MPIKYAVPAGSARTRVLTALAARYTGGTVRGWDVLDGLDTHPASQNSGRFGYPFGKTRVIGREQEAGLLLERWEQAKEGAGQVVLLSGEPGIGKSRLLQVLKERVANEISTQLECRCSPYHQNSALYPLIDLLQRVLQFERDDSPEERLRKLEVGALR